MKIDCFVGNKLDKINNFVQKALGFFHVAAIKSPGFACYWFVADIHDVKLIGTGLVHVEEISCITLKIYTLMITVDF